MASSPSTLPPPFYGGEAKLDKKITAPYGSWKSPITDEVVTGAEKRLSGIAVDGHGRLREVLVKEANEPGDEPIDITPKEFTVRTLAQEYGGKAFTVCGDTVVFSNYEDQRLYKQMIGDTRDSSINPTTTIVSITLNGETNQEPKVIVDGNDFYAFPRLDFKEERLASIEWGNPNMPWDKAELWVGYISKDGQRIYVAGGDPMLVESPSEPTWSSKGELFFITDRKNGFRNLYKWIEHRNEVVSIYSIDAEFTKPFWVFGACSFDFILTNGNNNLIACSYRQFGKSYLGILDNAQKSLTLLNDTFTDISNIVSGSDCIYVQGASSIHPVSVAKVTLDQSKSKAVSFSIMWSSSPNSTKYELYFSMPEPIEFPTVVAGQKAYAYFYPPSNPIYQASEEEKPPLLLESHGGPTDESCGVLDLNIQYWTSRGWAYVDVNYKGSTGYGREYRERLLGNWGIVDVNDCCSCARYLVESGKEDGERLCITGKSAVGYTTLASLAFRQTFKAGSSLFGASLRAEIPKFESHYIDNLVGSEDAFFERSPINYVDKFSCPVILFQGLDDKIVTPEQARKIHMALKNKELPVALVEYEGESHGFRKAENLKYTLEQQMVFFARLIGNFKVADEISPLKIDNVD
ncbi:hypothetical protein MKX01_005865 [Papaver californicum]|nr:hypothetical protein MKX01_005865 [Papaver californicum]